LVHVGLESIEVVCLLSEALPCQSDISLETIARRGVLVVVWVCHGTHKNGSAVGVGGRMLRPPRESLGQ